MAQTQSFFPFYFTILIIVYVLAKKMLLRGIILLLMNEIKCLVAINFMLKKKRYGRTFPLVNPPYLLPPLLLEIEIIMKTLKKY